MMSQDDNSGDPIERFHQAIERQVLLGKTAHQATSIVVRRYPKLHRAYLEAVNAGRGPAVDRAIRQRFADQGPKGGAR